MKKISKETVHTDFNDPLAVVHYTRAAHFIGLWESERTLITRFFPDQAGPLLEAGCGAGRATLGLWEMGYRNLTAFDFAEELLDQARSLAIEREAREIRFFQADVTKLTEAQSSALNLQPDGGFAGALFLFNGLMQIPGRENRRMALRELHAVCRPGAPLLFTTHDRDASPAERALWAQEAERWARGEQDARLIEFGDRYFEDKAGRTFMHLPGREEILADLAATGWHYEFDAMRREVARESRAVIEFSDECRFWLARRE
ncbi:MAG TPA: class I SAM-dependent methyltransferase [Opitutaceae bacterium]|nr:class I SAM-dependent methyltransferase [Opitutaceae bacterium]